MTPQEQKMLEDLANRIAQTPAPQPDAEAEQFIRTRIGSRPDALYLMTQTVLIQNLALEHAQQQIRDLQQQATHAPSSAPAGSGFLGGAAPPSYGPPQQQPPYQAAPPRSAGWFTGGQSGSGGGSSSFLHSAATTAAGVAAGALAFEGIRSLFGGFGHPGGLFGGPVQSGFLGGGGGLFGSSPTEETVVNNYYDSPDDQQTAQDSDDRDDSGDSGQYDDGSSQDADTGDYSDDGGNFDDGSSGGDGSLV